MSPTEFTATLDRIGWNERDVRTRLPCGTNIPRDWRLGTREIPDDVANWLLSIADAIDALPSPRGGAKRRPRITPSVDAYGLTEREAGVIENLKEGMTNEEIGTRLGVTETTVKNDLTSIMAKTGMQNRTQVAMWSVRVALARAAQQAAE